jgi:hypothetical protein
LGFGCTGAVSDAQGHGFVPQGLCFGFTGIPFRATGGVLRVHGSLVSRAQGPGCRGTGAWFQGHSCGFMGTGAWFQGHSCGAERMVSGPMVGVFAWSPTPHHHFPLPLPTRTKIITTTPTRRGRKKSSQNASAVGLCSRAAFMFFSMIESGIDPHTLSGPFDPVVFF